MPPFGPYHLLRSLLNALLLINNSILHYPASTAHIELTVNSGLVFIDIRNRFYLQRGLSLHLSNLCPIAPSTAVAGSISHWYWEGWAYKGRILPSVLVSCVYISVAQSKALEKTGKKF